MQSVMVSTKSNCRSGLLQQYVHVLSLAGCLVPSAAHAQSYFSRTYPSAEFHGGAMTPDGGVIVVCSDENSGYNEMLHTDSLGEVVWRASYESFGVNEQLAVFDSTPYFALFNDVATMGDSGFVVVGRAISTGPYDHGNQYMIGIFAADGTPLYAGTEGGSNVQEYVFAASGLGASAFFGGWNENMFAPIGTAGQLEFGATTYPHTAVTDNFGPGVFALDGTSCSDGGYLIAGVMVTQGPYFRKLDNTLTSTWSREYEVPASITSVEVAEAPDGTVFGASAGVADTLVVFRIDANGGELWTRSYSLPPGANGGAPTDLIVRPNGNVVISGSRWLMQLDADGTVLWLNLFSDRTIFSLEQDIDGNTFYVIGRLNNGGAGWMMRPDPEYGSVQGCASTPASIAGSLVTYSSVVSCCANSTSLTIGAPHVHIGSPTADPSTLECFSVDVPQHPVPEGVSVHPDPMSDAAHVILGEPLTSDGRIELIDVNGRVLRTIPGNSTRDVTIERGHLESGVYLLRVMREGEHTRSMRIVID
jgi:hypothetical protein